MKQTVLMLLLAMASSLCAFSLFAQSPVQNSGSAAATATPGNASTSTTGTNASHTNAASANTQTPQGVALSPAPAQQTQTDPANDVAELLAPRPLPPNPRLSLIGGTVVGLDRVRNHMDVHVFGGKKMRIDFDQRTHIYRDGVETTSLGIRKGDRVYVDTMLYGSQVFAKNVNVSEKTAQADMEGQVEAVDLGRKTFQIRDNLTGQTMPLSFGPGTTFTNQGHAGSESDLVAGSLVRVHYSSLGAGKATASNIYVMAARGNNYVFYGEVSHIDKRLNMIAIRSTTGDRFYDISVEGTGVPDNLRIGSTAKVSARFDGQKYIAVNIEIEQPSSSAVPVKNEGQNDDSNQQNPRQ